MKLYFLQNSQTNAAVCFAGMAEEWLPSAFGILHSALWFFYPSCQETKESSPVPVIWGPSPWLRSESKSDSLNHSHPRRLVWLVSMMVSHDPDGAFQLKTFCLPDENYLKQNSKLSNANKFCQIPNNGLLCLISDLLRKEIGNSVGGFSSWARTKAEPQEFNLP